MAAALVVVHSLTWDAVRYEDGEFIARSADLVAVGADKATLFRLSLLADMLGSYLVLLPAGVYLWRTLRPRAELMVDVVSAAGLAYTVVGGVGAAVLAAGGEPLIRVHADGTAPAAETAVAFGTLIDAVVGLWQIAAVLLGGVWWFGVGWLVRAEWRWFARFSCAFGVFGVLAAAGRVAGVDYEAAVPASPAFLFIAVWAGWLGVLLLRRPPLSPSVRQ